MGPAIATQAKGLIRASHPGPCLFITALAVALAAGGGALTDPGPLTVALLGVAVLAGQLSIGWSNDAFDASLDAAAGRSDKPIVAGATAARTALTAAYLALVLSLVGAFAIGARTGLLMIPVVGAGWAYNAGLKSTGWSGLMYVLGFGPIPALAASILPGHPWAPWWAFGAAALLGVGAHFINVLPDLASDGASGVRGLPNRLADRGGEPAVRLTGLGLLLAAIALIAFAPGIGQRWLMLVGLIGALLLAVAALRASGRTAFRCALGIAAIGVLMFVLAGGDLS